MSADKKNQPVVPIDADVKRRLEEKEARERALDQTIADSFPTSDPPSSIPNPAADDAA